MTENQAFTMLAHNRQGPMTPERFAAYRLVASDEQSDHEAGWYRDWMLELLDYIEAGK